jgi:uncharacterized membrane protein
MTSFDRIFAMLPLTWLDAAALVLFAATWAGYQWYADHSDTARPRLSREMDRFMREWLTRMAERDNRMVDVNVLRNLTRSSQFFASTTMLILGALVALMGYAEKAASVVADLPFTQQASERVWEFKILVLLLIFVYAFFKFSWSYRLFNYVAIIIGSVPVLDRGGTEAEAAAVARRAGALNVVAGRHFNRGQRAFFFALAYLGWFVSPYAFMAGTGAVLFVMWRRQFASDAREALLGDA